MHRSESVRRVLSLHKKRSRCRCLLEEEELLVHSEAS